MKSLKLHQRYISEDYLGPFLFEVHSIGPNGNELRFSFWRFGQVRQEGDQLTETEVRLAKSITKDQFEAVLHLWSKDYKSYFHFTPKSP